MKVVKYLLIILLTVQISHVDSVFAGQFERDAVDAVARQKISIQNYVQNILLSDVNSLQRQLLAKQGAMVSDVKSLTNLQSYIDGTADSFQNISSLNPEDLKNLKEVISEQLNQYDDLNRQYFAMTWMPTTMANSRNNFLTFLNNFIHSYAYMCEKGRNNISWDYNIPSNVEPMPVQFKFEVHSSPNNTANDGGQYEQYNYQTKTNIEIQRAGGRIFAGATFVNGMRANVSQMVGQVAHSLAPQVFSTGATAQVASSIISGVFIGVGVIMAVSAISGYLHGISEYNKLMLDYYNGEAYKVKNGASSKDISRIYTEKCKNTLQTFTLLQAKIQDYQKNGKVVSVTSLDDQQTKITKVEDEYEKLTGQEVGMESGRVIDVTPALLDIKNSEQTKIEELTRLKLNLAVDASIFFLETQYDNVLHHYSSILFEPLVRSREKALLKLTELIQIEEKVPRTAIKNELDISKQFLILRKEFLEIVADTFSLIFNKKSRGDVLSEFRGFAPRFDNFYSSYYNTPEVFQLGTAVQFLKKFLEKQ